MYYNPETKEFLSKEEVQNRVNASFPVGTERVFGWYLIDEDFLYPHLLENQYAVSSGIDFNNGKYARTYIVKEKSAESNVEKNENDETNESEDSWKARCSMLEQAILDLAQMVSNLEDYRIMREKQEES